MKLAHHDFETFSACDLRACGADVYAEHPSTGVLCLGYTLADEAPAVWRLGDPDPTPFLDHIAAGGAIACWNSAFEEAIWRHAIARLFPHWPQPQPEQFHDIMAWALAAALPAGLDDCAEALGLPHRKDKAGERIMKSVSKPRLKRSGALSWWHDDPRAADRFVKLASYCAQDVVVEREIARRVRPLSATERRVWILDRTINRRGILIDREAVLAARAVVKEEGARLDAAMAVTTGDAVPAATNVSALSEYLGQHNIAADVAKADVRALLSRPDLPAPVREALLIRQEAGKASTAKLKSLLAGQSADGRQRDLFQYHGATTGRWSGRRAQPQNFPRPAIKAPDVAWCLDAMCVDDAAELLRISYGAPLDIVSSCLRGMFIPAPGHRFIGGDFSNIEGRVLAWLAGELWKLDAFRAFDAKQGFDLYVLAFARAFDVPPESIGKESDQRQMGKVMELALGYQGGVGAFRSMAANYNMQLDELARAVEASASPEALAAAEKKRLWLQIEHQMHADLPAEQYRALRVLVDSWRAAHPSIKLFWRELEDAAMTAVANPGRPVSTATGLISFSCGAHYLYMRLPSGRVLSYARPSIEMVPDKIRGGDRRVVQFFVSGSREKDQPGPKKFVPVHAYGGLWSENATQAVARDILVEAMFRMEAAGYPIVLHVHDEARAEVPYGRGSVAECRAVMSQSPAWAGNLPIAVGCEEMTRYHK